ncbi:MAG TPA: hypothetical protein VFA66_06975 [Gaiellaceae bacterium]|nr:hypothetical protein [Gaiellaceae bacterium]
MQHLTSGAAICSLASGSGKSDVKLVLSADQSLEKPGACDIWTTRLPSGSAVRRSFRAAGDGGSDGSKR